MGYCCRPDACLIDVELQLWTEDRHKVHDVTL